MAKIELPHELRTALLSVHGDTAVPVGTDDGCAIVLKLNRRDIDACHRAGVIVRFTPALATVAHGAPVRMEIEMHDQPSSFVAAACWLNPASAHDLDLLRTLAAQEHLDFHFMTYDLTYIFTKRIRLNPATRRDLDYIIDQALAHLATVRKPDFPTAKQEMEQVLREMTHGR